MGNFVRVKLNEGVISKNIADSGVNFNPIRDKLYQRCLVGIGDGRRCDLFKDKAHSVG